MHKPWVLGTHLAWPADACSWVPGLLLAPPPPLFQPHFFTRFFTHPYHSLALQLNNHDLARPRKLVGALGSVLAKAQGGTRHGAVGCERVSSRKEKKRGLRVACDGTYSGANPSMT